METNGDLCGFAMSSQQCWTTITCCVRAPWAGLKGNNPLWGEMGITVELPEAKPKNNVPLWRCILDFHGFNIELIVGHNLKNTTTTHHFIWTMDIYKSYYIITHKITWGGKCELINQVFCVKKTGFAWNYFKQVCSSFRWCCILIISPLLLLNARGKGDSISGQ